MDVGQEYWMTKMTEELEQVMSDAEQEAIKKLTININAAMNSVHDDFYSKVDDVAEQYADGIYNKDLTQAANHYKMSLNTVIRDGLVQALQDEFRLKAHQC